MAERWKFIAQYLYLFLKLLCEDFENITQLEQLATAFTENNITFEDAMSAALE